MVGVESIPEKLVASPAQAPMAQATPSQHGHTNGVSRVPEPISPIVDLTKTRKMDEIERQAILFTLQKTQGNVVDAARMLGLGPATVYRKIKRYGVRAKAIAAAAQNNQ